MDRLFINNQEVEFGEEVNIYLTYRSNIMGDVSKIFGNNSATIKVPVTSHNSKVIDYANILTTSTAFPLLRHTGKVVRDGVTIVDNATVVLLGTNENEYEITLAWGASENLRQLAEADDKLPVLAEQGEEILVWEYPPYPHAGTEQCPEAMYGFQRVIGNVAEAKYGYHPVVSVADIWTRIEAHYGITMLATESSAEALRNLFMPILRSGSPSVLCVSERYLDVDKKPDIVEHRQAIPWDKTTDPLKPNTAYTPHVSISGVVANIELKVYCTTATGEADLTDLTSVALCKVKDQEYETLLEIPCSYIEFVGNGNWKCRYSIDLEDDIGEVGRDEYFSWYFVTKGKYDYIYLNGMYGGSYANVTESAVDIQIGERYYLYHNLPDIKVLDFIKGITQMLGMYACSATDNTIAFNDYNTLLDRSNAVDWSNKMVQENADVSYSQDVFCKRNNVTYKDDTTATGMNSHFDISNEILDNEGDYISLPFSAMRKTNDTLRNGIVSIPVYREEEKDGTKEVEKDGDEKKIYICKRREYTAYYNNTKGWYLHRDGLDWDSLLKTYYSKLIESVQEMHYLTATFYFTPIDLERIDMSKMIYLSQYASYFAIIEIKTKANNLAEVKLLKLV